MARGLKSSLLWANVLAMLVAVAAGAQSPTDGATERQASEQQATQEHWVGCFHEILEMSEAAAPQETEATESPQETCPCFERSELDALPSANWDLCLDSAFVVQASSWSGRSSAAGREGFNVLVSAACERTPEGSCQFLHKFRVDGEMQQTYRRLENISPADAMACGRIMANWLSSRGGCRSSMVVETD